MNSKDKIRFQKKHLWIWLGLSALILRFIFGLFPEFCELVYSRFFFVGIRIFIDYSWASLSPVAVLYFMFIGLIILLINSVFGFYHQVKNKVSKREIINNILLKSANFIGAVLFFFLVLWGFNYARVPLEKTIGIEVRELDKNEIRQEADYIMKKTVALRNQIKGKDSSEFTQQELFPKDLESEMRACLVQVLEEFGYPTYGKVRGREIYPKGLLYGFNSSGVYLPFSGEGHIESALHIVQKPFTMAHEMAHGYGFGDEGTCNFLGYLACLKSKNLAVQYSGFISYYRYVIGQLDKEYYLKLTSTIDRGLYNDLKAIREAYRKYGEFIPGLQELTYEAYLQMQGIEDGLMNYDRMVLVVAAYRKKRNDI
jgi:hypothetical protein